MVGVSKDQCHLIIVSSQDANDGFQIKYFKVRKKNVGCYELVIIHHFPHFMINMSCVADAGNFRTLVILNFVLLRQHPKMYCCMGMGTKASRLEGITLPLQTIHDCVNLSLPTLIFSMKMLIETSSGLFLSSQPAGLYNIQFLLVTFFGSLLEGCQILLSTDYSFLCML